MATDNIRNLSNVRFQDAPDYEPVVEVIGEEKHVFISKRTDGKNGSGLLSDPYDGSTQVKFDAIHANNDKTPADTAIHYAPDTIFPSKGVVNFQVKSGWQIIAHPTTIFQLAPYSAADVTALASSNNPATIFGCQGTATVGSAVLVEDVVFDGGIYDLNMANQTQLLTPSAINLFGDGVKILNNTQIGWNSTKGFEAFPVSVSSNGSAYARVHKKGVVCDNILFKQPGAVTQNGQISLLAPCQGQNVVSGSAVSNGWFQDVTVRNCKWQDITTADVECLNLGGNVQGAHVHHNMMRSVTGASHGIYWDTGSGLDILIENNQFLYVYYAINTIGVAGNVRQRVVVDRNHIFGGAYIGIGVNESSDASDWTFSDNYVSITNADGGCIGYYNIVGVRLLNNTCDLPSGGTGTEFFGTGSTGVQKKHNTKKDGTQSASLLDNIPTYVNLNTGTPTVATSASFQYVGADGVAPIGIIDSFGNNSTFVGRRANGTAASKTGVVAGDVLAAFGGRGYTNAGSYVTLARALVRIISAETWSSSVTGAYLDFQTTPIGANVAVSSGRIQPSGGASFGTAAIALADPGNGIVLAGKANRIIAVTFANAVTSPVEGTIQPFTDSSTSSIGGVITGGGANHVIGYYNGTNWVVIGGSGVGTSATIQTTLKILKGDNAGNAIEATENGTGNVVLTSNAVLITPTLGVALATSINGNFLTVGSSTYTGVAGQTYTFPQETTNVGYREIPQNSKSANYTTVLADNGKEIFHPVGDNNARTFTIDSNANVAQPIGCVHVFTNLAVAALTVAITSDTMTLLGAGTTGSRTIAQYGQLVARKVTSTSWVCYGVNVS